MNVKLHTPKSLKSGSGMSTMKQLLEVKPGTAQANQTISELQKRQEQFLQAIEAGRQK